MNRHSIRGWSIWDARTLPALWSPSASCRVWVGAQPFTPPRPRFSAASGHRVAVCWCVGLRSAALHVQMKSQRQPRHAFSNPGDSGVTPSAVTVRSAAVAAMAQGRVSECEFCQFCC
jgi:hypothetical protein